MLGGLPFLETPPLTMLGLVTAAVSALALVPTSVHAALAQSFVAPAACPTCYSSNYVGANSTSPILQSNLNSLFPVLVKLTVVTKILNNALSSFFPHILQMAHCPKAAPSLAKHSVESSKSGWRTPISTSPHPLRRSRNSRRKASL